MLSSMGEGKKECFDDPPSDLKEKDQWVVNKSSSSSSMEDSTISDVSSASSSSSSLEITDDASSSFSSSSAQESINGSLYDLSDLMTKLPIKRGLSKYYQGKSESFTCLSRVTSVEDLVKKESPYKRRKILKGCKSYGGGLDNYKSYTLPKPIISKKCFKGSSFSSSSFPSRNGSFTSSLRPPLIPSQENLDMFK